MMIFAYDNRGILTAHRVPERQSVNEECYKTFTMKFLRSAVRKKAPSNYYWPSQGGTFAAVSFILCSVLFNF